jgi:hypothetical protein
MHTPIVSRSQQRLFGAELSRRQAGEEPVMMGITNQQLEEHLEESRGKELPEYARETKGRKLNITDRFMNEVVVYGGIPLRRADVYRDVLKRTGSAKAADLWAFSSQTKKAPPDAKPLTLDEYQKISPLPSVGKRMFKITGKMPRLSRSFPRISEPPVRITQKMRRI